MRSGGWRRRGCDSDSRRWFLAEIVWRSKPLEVIAMKPRLLAIGMMFLVCTSTTAQSPGERALLLKLKNEKSRVESLEQIIDQPDVYSATILFVGAKVAFQENRLEDSGFLYYAGQLRARFDRECFPPKGTGGNDPNQFYGVLSHNCGQSINPAVMSRPDVFAKVLDRVKKWQPKVPEEYEPDYEFVERRPIREAINKSKKNRNEFINWMSDLSTLLNDKEYFAAFRIIQQHNLGSDDSNPTDEEYEAATETIKRIEKEKKLKGIFGL
jgi:hypothetical protein